MGLTDDLIHLCLAERFPDKFDSQAIIQQIQEENELIYNAMMEKSFRPFHETLSNDISYGEIRQADEEATQTQIEETANPETESVPESEADG
jgi:hypothetical protein